QRCEKSTLCGPPGLIVTARTSDGAVANVRAVDAGTFTSGLAQSDVVAEAVDLVVAASSKIASVSDLRRKRVSLGAEGSGSLVTARAVLAAWRLRERHLKASFDPPEIAAQKLARDELD